MFSFNFPLSVFSFRFIFLVAILNVNSTNLRRVLFWWALYQEKSTLTTLLEGIFFPLSQTGNVVLPCNTTQTWSNVVQLQSHLTLRCLTTSLQYFDMTSTLTFVDHNAISQHVQKYTIYMFWTVSMIIGRSFNQVPHAFATQLRSVFTCQIQNFGSFCMSSSLKTTTEKLCQKFITFLTHQQMCLGYNGTTRIHFLRGKVKSLNIEYETCGEVLAPKNIG